MQQSEQTESEAGNVGSEEWIAGMHDMLAAGLARLQNPPPFHPTPSDRRTQAALQEILSIEGEIKKGPAGNPLVAERADLLRKDVWDRWRAGEGIAAAAPDPLTQAISKLTDVADRQLSLMASVASPTTIHQPAAAPALGWIVPPRLGSRAIHRAPRSRRWSRPRRGLASSRTSTTPCAPAPAPAPSQERSAPCG
jgi:hypothetical protein